MEQTMIRTVEEFQRAAIERKVARWDIHKCSMCGYSCGYIIGEGVMYDSGCDCSWGGARPSSWEDLADHYNRNQPENNPRAEGKPWLAEMQAFWGFDA